MDVVPDGGPPHALRSVDRLSAGRFGELRSGCCHQLNANRFRGGANARHAAGDGAND